MLKIGKAHVLPIMMGFFLLSGCATTGEIPAVPPSPAQKAVYHKIQKGETLWRVAQNYNVSLETLKKVNHIPDVAVVEVGQLILIPGADSEKPVAAPVVDVNSREFAWPIQGRVVEYYGERKNGISGKGIGIAVSSGEKVSASRSGKVVFADYLSGYSYTVIIDHADGYSSVYSNNDKLLVKSGDHVSKGDAIAEGGAKGVLGFQIRRHTIAENPLYFLPKI